MTVRETARETIKEYASAIVQRLDAIDNRLDKIEEWQREDIGRVHDKIEVIKQNGCSQSPAHDRIREDHESRLRVCERYIYRQAGQVAVIGGLGGMVAAALVALGRLILRG